MITHLEPDILECEVKWALGSIITNKASGGDGIPVKLFQRSEERRVGPPKADRSWWRVLTKHGPLEKGMANHFSIRALRTPWTVWKGKTVVTKIKSMIAWGYFKSWKMMLWKCYTQYASKFGKLSNGHRTGKGQFSFQSQTKTLPQNVQSTI